MSAYPNPASDKVTVKWNKNEKMNLTLTDVKGRIVFENTVSESLNSIDLIINNSGIYFITLSSEENGKWVEKIVVQ